MVDVKLIMKWTQKLESGEYNQGTGRLKTDLGYCCLGVLCDISGRGKWDEYIYVTENDSKSHNLPQVLSGKISSCVSQDELTDMNDVKKKSFKEIASYIREKLRRYLLNEWVYALKTKGTRNCLKQDCAIGVLCDISQLGTWKKDKFSMYSVNECYIVLKLLDWMLTTDQWNKINKMEGKNFEEIADYINTLI